MRTGKLKERTLKFVHLDPDGYPSPPKYYYADPGTSVQWDGGEGNPEHYGGRRILWCMLETGEQVGLEEGEVEWSAT